MTLHWGLLVTLFLVFEWLLRVLMVFLVAKGRKPSSATAWLMLIMLEPVIGTTAFLAFGTPRLPKQRRFLQKYAESHIAAEFTKLGTQNNAGSVSPSDLSEVQEQLVKLNQSLGGLPVFGGNDVQFFDEYSASIDSLVQDINKAKTRIFFEYFILALDATSEPVIVALEAAVKRGVEVYVLYDALASRIYPNFKHLKRRLNSSGIQWRPMLPFNMRPGKTFTRPDLRNHRKIVTIDGQIGYTGSQNIINKNYHRRDELCYEELVVRVEGPIVWQLASVFRTDWYAETHVFLPADIPGKPKNNVKAQVLPSGPGQGGSNNLKLYASLFHAATEKIVIVTPYFIPDDALMTALTSAAERGVDVSIINSEIIDKLLVGHAQRSYYDELLASGIKVYLYKSPVFLHTKHVTVDSSVAVVGSSNLDIRSFDLNLEVTMVMYDHEVVNKLRTIEKRYKENCVQINKHAWGQRPLRLKSLDNVARLTAALQ